MNNMQEFIESTIREAGRAVMKHFGHASVVYTKADANDVVTQADLDSNKIITEAIRKAYPDHAIVSEESEDTSTNEEYKWYIDPLDGTKNFSTHVPLFAINIALVKNGVVTHGAIYAPYFDELVYVEKGNGAWLNGNKLPMVSEVTLADSFGVMNTIRDRKWSRIGLAIVEAADSKKLWVNSLGSMALASLYLATGRRNWYITPGEAWDCAAPVIALQEVGYRVTDLDGNEWRPTGNGMAAAHPTLHKQLIEIVKQNS